ncbi:hypothetical protein [Fodinicola acaciae]|uniref:hypothetical protein n=1 Tax=Fodinicola acaciae TaxID=2681555 RepID=UPI0013D0E272|nr:hypothetical protein [Fodinicola acaciae]
MNQPADPADVTEQSTPVVDDEPSQLDGAFPAEADEADVVDQRHPVPINDEEYQT